ncbi:MAG: HAD family hydrolase [Nevskiaceae bacterium]|nr:MAG: HAD family hydrolase [Nevskiaceae bacterium]
MSWRVRGVLFDLDGTLVDTAPDLGGAANHVRAQLGLPPLPLDDYRPVASAGARGLLGKALGIGPDHADFPRHRDAFLAHYRANLSKASRLFDGMDALLRALEAQGIRWGVVTNKPSWLTKPLLEELNLQTRSACDISADEVPRAKPAPDGILRACERLGLAPADGVYVGDDKRDIDAGRAAGMKTVAADWGYLGDNGPITSWGADVIAATPAALAGLIGVAL